MPARPAVRTILFDVGNTLAFLDHARLARVLERGGHRRGLEEVRAAEHRARRRLCAAGGGRDDDASRWQRFLDALVVEAEIAPEEQEAVRDSIHRAHEAENLWRFVPEETHATLEELCKDGFRLGVVSNADGRVASLLLDLDLHHRFDVIVDSFHVGFEKPDPEIFRIALRALDASPETALYVGDLYSVDVLGARAAGMEAALLDPLGLAREPDCAVLRTIGEVRGLVNAAARSGERGSLPRT